MSVTPEPQYEFTSHQAELVRSLAAKMGGVGFVFAAYGVLLIAYGIALFVALPVPAVLPKEGASADLAAPGIFRPMQVIVAASVHGLVGLIYLLIGLWTCQAAAGFRGVAQTRGQDVSRLMEALAALHKMYALVYNLLLLAALLLLVAVGLTLYRVWGG